jgi:hypothetical protein
LLRGPTRGSSQGYQSTIRKCTPDHRSVSEGLSAGCPVARAADRRAGACVRNTRARIKEAGVIAPFRFGDTAYASRICTSHPSSRAPDTKPRRACRRLTRRGMNLALIADPGRSSSSTPCGLAACSGLPRRTGTHCLSSAYWAPRTHFVRSALAPSTTHRLESDRSRSPGRTHGRLLRDSRAARRTSRFFTDGDHIGTALWRAAHIASAQEVCVMRSPDPLLSPVSRASRRLSAWPPTHAGRARAPLAPPSPGALSPGCNPEAPHTLRRPCDTLRTRCLSALAGVLHSLKPGRTHTAVPWSKRSPGHHAAGDRSSRRESDLRAVACDNNNDQKHLSKHCAGHETTRHRARRPSAARAAMRFHLASDSRRRFNARN